MKHTRSTEEEWPSNVLRHAKSVMDQMRTFLSPEADANTWFHVKCEVLLANVKTWV
jgi:hypothetical protein